MSANALRLGWAFSWGNSKEVSVAGEEGAEGTWRWPGQEHRAVGLRGHRGLRRLLCMMGSRWGAAGQGARSHLPGSMSFGEESCCAVVILPTVACLP